MRKLIGAIALACVLAPALADAAKLNFGGRAPTIVRTFTTTLGDHYFNGTQLVTCATSSSCTTQALVAQDVVPFNKTGGYLLVIDDPQAMRVCTLDLVYCSSIFVQNFPGAIALTPDGAIKLQGAPYACGYTPTAGVHCSIVRQPTTLGTEAAKAFVGQVGIDPRSVQKDPNLTTYGFGPAPSYGFTDETSTFEGFDGFGGDLGMLASDDSDAYDQFGWALPSFAAETHGECLARCAHDKDVDNNSCYRLAGEMAFASTYGSAVVGGVVGLRVGGVAGAVAGFAAFRNVGGGLGLVTGGVGAGCLGLAAIRANDCYASCPATTFPDRP